MTEDEMEALREVKARLGAPGASGRAADAVLDVLSRRAGGVQSAEASQQ